MLAVVVLSFCHRLFCWVVHET